MKRGGWSSGRRGGSREIFTFELNLMGGIDAVGLRPFAAAGAAVGINRPLRRFYRWRISFYPIHF